MDNSKLPAYPASVHNTWREGSNGEMYEIKDDYEGMTKLEAFTMAAMQGLCANQSVITNTQGAPTISPYLITMAVNIAGDTLSELSKHQ